MTSKADVAERHIEIGDLAVLLWRAKFAILGIVLIAAIIAAVIVYQKPDVYRSELKAQPAEGLARSTGGLGGLSALGSIAGIELGADAVKGVDLAIAILQSRKFLTDFAQRHNAIVPLLAGKEWDSDEQVLLLDGDIFDAAAGRWTRKAATGLPNSPTDEEIYGKFRKILDVEQDPVTGLVTIRVTFLSPRLAQSWTALLVEDLNRRMKLRHIKQTDRELAFLDKRIATNELSSMRGALEQLYLSQLRERVLAQAKDEFALEVVDPAYLPLTKHGPNRPLIILIAALAGLLMGMIGTVLGTVFRRNS